LVFKQGLNVTYFNRVDVRHVVEDSAKDVKVNGINIENDNNIENGSFIEHQD